MSERLPNKGPVPPSTVGGDMAAVVLGLASRLRLGYLTDRHDRRTVLALFAFVNGLVAIAAVAAVAVVTDEPFVLPSLGASAFLLFSSPLLPAAAPRNAVGGHLIGALAGYVSLVAFGLTDVVPALDDLTGTRVAAVALSLGLTSGAMMWARVPHPPAGATTLLVSLGLLREPEQLVVLMLAVTLLVVQGFLINRLAGIPYPAWRPASPA